MATVWTRLTNFFKVGRGRHFIGKDLHSNKYYEFPSLDGSMDPRRTRRLVQYRIHKELGEHDQGALPVQWLMWLRHTRKSAPTIEELRQDQERIAITQHNARVLELRDAERRMQLEARAAEDAQRMRIEADVTKPLARGGRGDATGAGQTAGRDGRVGAETETEAHPDARRTTVPTSQISDREADAERARRVDWEYQRDPETFVQQRTVDMDVWEASRRRVDAKNAQQSQHEQGGSQVEPTLKDAHDRRAARRAEMDKREAERERARRFMMQSPLSAFDVSTGSWEQRPKQQQQQQSTAAPGRQRLGRPSNPSGEWSPEAWQPRPAERGSK